MNEVLLSLLKEMAFFLELNNENPFKVRAFLNAARVLKNQEQDITKLSNKELLAIDGIGKGIAAVIEEYKKAGIVAVLKAIQKKFPSGIWELAEIPGLGVKKIKILLKELNIGSQAELEYACQENRLIELKGFGEKIQKNLLKNLAHYKTNRGRILLPSALEISKKLAKEIQKKSFVEKLMEVGEVRLLSQTIGSIDFLIHYSSIPNFTKKDFSFLDLKEVKATDEDMLFSVEDERGFKVKIFGWNPKRKESFAFMGMRLTGSKSFWNRIASQAIKYKKEETEEKIFSKMKLPWIEPEQRELAIKQEKRQGKLIEERDIQGLFHLHTKESDGLNTLEEMAGTCRSLGFSYMGVSDHSQSAHYANGLKEDGIKAQRKEIDRLNKKYPDFYIFHGIESDILENGQLDYPVKILKSFDFVIASIHSRFEMKKEEMTKRICTALKNPYTTWLGHPTGRILLGRKGYDFDMDAVLKVAKQEKKGIELNANPYRLDLDWKNLQKAKSLQIPIGIFPDAHSVKGIQDISYGVMMARKAGLSPKDISNTKQLSEMQKWLAQRKKH